MCLILFGVLLFISEKKTFESNLYFHWILLQHTDSDGFT